MAKTDNMSDYLFDMAEAIRERTKSVDKIKPIDFPGIIENLAVEGVYVYFYDYDGTILHEMLIDDFMSLDQMPELPSHDGLICQGWNYTLNSAKSYIQKYGRLNIGAIYITDDNKTRLYINLSNGGINVPLYINQSKSNNVIVDWGDGSDSETISSSGNVKFNHTYNEAGSYIISLTVDSGACTLGHNNSSYNVMGPTSTIASNSLYKVEIGTNIYIESYAFQYCRSLSSVTIPNLFASIGTQAFQGCYSLSSLVLPNSLSSIRDYAFRGCYSLSSLVLPNSLSSIGGGAFSSCYSLSSIFLPNSVKSVGYETFHSCYSLTSLVLPNSVKSVGNSAFRGCRSLSSLVLSNSLESIDTYAFCDCNSLSSITIPNSVTSIKREAFLGCNSLSSIVLSNSVTSINEYTFSGCYSLSSIALSNSLKSIGLGAFYDCRSLTSITIPNSVTSISRDAFIDGSSIQYYDFTACTSIPTLSSTSVFNVKAGCVIRVPYTLYDDWKKATNWSKYADYIAKDIDITEYTSLTITADDVSGRKTKTTIYWEAIASGFNNFTGEVVTGIKFTGTDVSDEFEQNTSTTDTVTRTITYTKYGLTATTTITQGVWEDKSCTIDLNSNWQLSSTIPNPDSSLYDGVYESYSNKGKDSTAAIMYIDIVGYTDFDLYIRSYAESSFDYVMVSQLDQDINNSTSYSNTTLVKAHTRGSQTSGTAISNYKLVEFTGIDSNEHRITVVYRKDSSSASGLDQGYLIIPKQ